MKNSFLEDIHNELTELESSVGTSKTPQVNEKSTASIESILSDFDTIGTVDFTDDLFSKNKESLASSRKDEVSFSDLINVQSDATVVHSEDGTKELTQSPLLLDSDTQPTTPQPLLKSRLKEESVIIDDEKVQSVLNIWDSLDNDVVNKDQSVPWYLQHVQFVKYEKKQESVLDRINERFADLNSQVDTLWKSLSQPKSLKPETQIITAKSQPQLVETTEHHEKVETRKIEDPLAEESTEKVEVHTPSGINISSKPKFQPPKSPHEITEYQKKLTGDGYIYLLSHQQLEDLLGKKFCFPGLILHDIILRFIPEQAEFFLTKGSKSDFDTLPENMDNGSNVFVFALSRNFYVVYIEQFDEYYLVPNNPIVIQNANVKYIKYCELNKMAALTTQLDSVTSYLSSVDKKMGDSILNWAKSWF
ncbi:hypothetical protein EIN_152480 [Entamoeba invadens IP1]|uniref:Uncharacterized protein n=1 Tax=Entamoeba invadens IP1 TaxID=370355 RepID=A0A0A1UEL2_ENTIV|nr:hypothetical protein EIN_152480 [Entamoeba invadens IP1]ELP91271.1 hypothetical protein EIN_152480 [Entamoeba invadens IP1]|eukprot:XP_004258042.1 hypothetical protein EIN_152480 [Entamoeba invadens IP1]